uniref:Uncharacterized protein n=1 Tax=Caenorhabditis japonica TaxID=281687 RepID=A0A8R1DJ52_CAEJA
MNINNENDNCEDSSLIAEYFEKKTAIYDFHFPPLDNDIEVGEELSKLAMLQSMNQLINTFNLLLVDRMNSVLKTCKREDIFVLPGAVDLFFLTQRPEKIHLPSLVFERPTRREKRREAR